MIRVARSDPRPATSVSERGAFGSGLHILNMAAVCGVLIMAATASSPGQLLTAAMKNQTPHRVRRYTYERCKFLLDLTFIRRNIGSDSDLLDPNTDVVDQIPEQYYWRDVRKHEVFREQQNRYTQKCRIANPSPMTTFLAAFRVSGD